MLECKEMVQGKVTIGNTQQEITFFHDKIYKKWIIDLLDVYKVISDKQTRLYLTCEMQGLDVLKQEEFSFLFTSSRVIQQILYVLIKDELSGGFSNTNLKVYSDYVTKAKDESERNFSFAEIKKMICQEFNEVISGIFYDTYISIWSCFEDAINGMTRAAESEIQEALEKSRYKKLEKFLNKCTTDSHINFLPETIDQLVNGKEELYFKELPVFISLTDKINHIFKIIEKDYNRDIKEDKKILLFWNARRNTIHNNGVHMRDNMTIELKGKTFSLQKGEAIFSASLSEEFSILFNELLDIYFEIISCVVFQKCEEKTQDI